MENKHNFMIPVDPANIRINIPECKDLLSLYEKDRFFSQELFSTTYGFYSASVRLNPNLVRIVDVERRLTMSRNTIIRILSEAGYYIPNKDGFYLNHDHVTILAQAYAKSLRQLFKRTKKTLQTLTPQELQSNANFFRLFIRNSYILEPTEVFSKELDQYLIERWVFNSVTTDPVEWSQNESFSRMFRRLKFKLQKLFKDIRTQIFSIVVTHHYHVFPSEEDISEKAKPISSFSETIPTWIRKAIINQTFITAFNHEKYRTLNI